MVCLIGGNDGAFSHTAQIASRPLQHLARRKGVTILIFSTSVEYAIRALAELVLMSQDAPKGDGGRRRYVRCESLCLNADLPREHVSKILLLAVHAKILISSKGPGGGFALARPAHDISLLDVIMAVDGENKLDGCIVGLARCGDQMHCPQHDLFMPIRRRLRDYVSATTLADLAVSLREKKAMTPDSADEPPSNHSA